MKKQIILPLLLTGVLAFTVVPAASWANTKSLETINRELQRIQAEINANKARSKETDKKIAQVRSQRAQLEEELMNVELRLNETVARLEQLDEQIEDTKQKAVAAQEELDLAIDRVAQREVLVNTRLKAIYERGTVSYLEVLLGSTSFHDFLTRLDALQLIFEQDKRILEENLEDKRVVEEKKQEVDKHLASLTLMFTETEALKDELDKQYKLQSAVKEELRKKEQEYEHSKEEDRKALLALSDQYSKTLAEKNKLLIPKASNALTGGKLGMPLKDPYRLTSGFGLRKDPFTGKQAGHDGIDMAAPLGTPIYAAESGVVTFAGYYSGYGNVVMIQHDETLRTMYAHIRENGIKVKLGQRVEKGEKIAEVGSTGRSTGNHLHFTVFRNNQAVDPMPYLR